MTRQAAKVQKNLGLRAEARLERQLVDNRFAALREVVTGQTEQRTYGGSGAGGNLGSTLSSYSGGARSAMSSALSGAGSSNGGSFSGARPALEGVTSLLNEFYTVLVVADTAISTNSLPPAGNDVGAKMRLEGSKLPAPFKEVLIGLADSGSEKVTEGAASILRVQAQAQMDRLLGLMALQVTEPCRRGIEGRYPFVSVAGARRSPRPKSTSTTSTPCSPPAVRLTSTSPSTWRRSSTPACGPGATSSRAWAT